MTEEERKRQYGPEKGHYDAEHEIYEDPNALAVAKTQAEAEQAEADANHAMLDSNRVQANAIAAAAAAATKAGAQMVSGGTEVQTPSPTVATKATSAAVPAATDSGNDNGDTQINLDKARQDVVNGINDANRAQEQDFAKMMLDYRARIDEERQEQRRKEAANMMSTMATGTTELAAGLINLFSVGGLHASNQQYRSYSQDWMKKAEEDIKEHRRRRDNMRDALDRLKMQQNQIRNANLRESLSLQYKMAQDKAAAERQAQMDKENREYRQWQQQQQERQFERQARQTDASIAQGWARIQQSKDLNTTSMLAQGWVPDATAPGGFRYDPQQAAKYGVSPASSSSSSSRSGSGSSSVDDFPVIDANGEVNIARLRPHEVEYLRDNAREAIKQDLGPEDAIQFANEFRRAQDDKGRNSVLAKWMGRSKTCEDIIRSMDADYRGKHGERQSQPENISGYSRGKSSQDLINEL